MVAHAVRVIFLYSRLHGTLGKWTPLFKLIVFYLLEQWPQLRPWERLLRCGLVPHSSIVRHKLQTTLLWWRDEDVQDAQDFVECTGALERAEVVRARLLGDG